MVLDNVYHAKDAAPFLSAAGSKCGLLFTTRSRSVAFDLAGGSQSICALAGLSENSAMELLESLAPVVRCRDCVQQAKALVRVVGGSPSALRVAAALIVSKAGVKQHSTLRSWMQKLVENPWWLLGEPVPVEMSNCISGERPALRELLDRSLGALDAQTRQGFVNLGASLQWPYRFDQEALSECHLEPHLETLIETLVNEGILEPDRDGGPWHMHAIMAALANVRAQELAPTGAMLLSRPSLWCRHGESALSSFWCFQSSCSGDRFGLERFRGGSPGQRSSGR